MASPALREKGIVAERLDAHSALQNLRILPVGNGPAGNSEYTVLLSGAHVVAAQADSTAPARKNYDNMVLNTPVKNWMPADSTANLVRQGILNCHSGSCEFVLIPL